ncbi:site-specific DNA-methyltransferase [Candidatus Poribacteria bacterium]|nr:site-specific DNA-methyltransferase [Candidatus Poribacteria bacterium]
MLNWKGKRPFQSTQYHPAQLKETYGEEVEGWNNKIYWGDNLQVMSHLLKTYRRKIDLIYIDPPFDSKAEYKKGIALGGEEIENDRTAFEEKQYTDIWTNDEYLQFMYERLVLMKELLADDGSIYLHCDPNKSHYLKVLMDTEIFNKDLFRNEVVWFKGYRGTPRRNRYQQEHDIILFYSKSKDYVWNDIYGEYKDTNLKRYNKVDEEGKRYALIKRVRTTGEVYYGKTYPKGKLQGDVIEIPVMASTDSERLDYPTQKPETLIERIIKASSNPGDLVFDCFMGSGTTQAVAMKLGRRFIGADINLGAVETTTKRLLSLAAEVQKARAQSEISSQEEGSADSQTCYTGFEVYNVNHYDVFRNPVEAEALLIEALEIQPLPTGSIYDGEKEGRMVKLMPINRIATRADLNDLIFGFDNKVFQRREEEHPTRPVEKLLLVCMGHEPDLAAALQNEVAFALDIEVIDILRDKSNLEFRRESEAEIVRRNGQLIIEQFYPMNLLQKLSLMKENVENWKELVESVKIDFNYDGAVLNPSLVDLSDGDKFVKGTYPIPTDAGATRVKITDLLSESLEMTVE